MSKIAWCTGHYTTDYAKEKAKELRNLGYTVSFGYYIKENDKTYCRIYLTKNLNYYVLNILKSIKSRIKYDDMTIYESVNSVKDQLKDVCKRFNVNIRIELDNGQLIAKIDDKKELSLSI